MIEKKTENKQIVLMKKTEKFLRLIQLQYSLFAVFFCMSVEESLCALSERGDK